MRYLFLFALFLGGFVMLSAYIALPGSVLKANDQPAPQKPPSSRAAKSSEVAFKEFRHGFKDKEGNTWEIQAKEATLMKAQNLADLEGVRLLLTTPKDQCFTLSSKAGQAHFLKEFDQPTKVELKGDVHVAFPKGFSLKTETLTFIPSNRLITTKDSVLIEGPGVWLKGKGLEATLKDNAMKLGGAPLTRLKPSRLPGGDRQ